MGPFRYSMAGRLMYASSALFFLAFAIDSSLRDSSNGPRALAVLLSLSIGILVVSLPLGFRTHVTQVTLVLCVGPFIAFLVGPPLFSYAHSSDSIMLLCFVLAGGSVVGCFWPRGRTVSASSGLDRSDQSRMHTC